jgi:hypothetical protein
MHNTLQAATRACGRECYCTTHVCLSINLIDTFYITLCPSVGVLRVSFFWNFDFIVFTNSVRKERVLEGICSATDLAYFVAFFQT